MSVGAIYGKNGSYTDSSFVIINISFRICFQAFLVTRTVDLSVVERAFEDGFSGAVGGGFGVAEVSAGRRLDAGLRRRRSCRQKHNRRCGRQ